MFRPVRLIVPAMVFVSFSSPLLAASAEEISISVELVAPYESLKIAQESGPWSCPTSESLWTIPQ